MVGRLGGLPQMRAHLEPIAHDLVSILKFLEANLGLPTLASVNHLFDESTPEAPTTRRLIANRPDHPPHPGIGCRRSAT
jgi:hypothetical protein